MKAYVLGASGVALAAGGAAGVPDETRAGGPCRERDPGGEVRFLPSGSSGAEQHRYLGALGNGDAIKSWKVELTGGGKAQKSWSGDSKYLPASLTWDGKSDTGSMAPEGTYTAKLSIDYAAKYQSAWNRARASCWISVLPRAASAWTRRSSPPRRTESRDR